MLINPKMAENERHKRNIERRKQKSDYSAYDEETVDEFGMVSYFLTSIEIIPLLVQKEGYSRQVR